LPKFVSPRYDHFHDFRQAMGTCKSIMLVPLFPFDVPASNLPGAVQERQIGGTRPRKGGHTSSQKPGDVPTNVRSLNSPEGEIRDHLLAGSIPIPRRLATRNAGVVIQPSSGAGSLLPKRVLSVGRPRVKRKCRKINMTGRYPSLLTVWLQVRVLSGPPSLECTSRSQAGCLCL
jgi:hypothetical protein